jgi:hypothetical protein
MVIPKEKGEEGMKRFWKQSQEADKALFWQF